jgi:sigma-54 dependent transcriptional regulator, flagellar regulatory protein
MRLIPTKNDVKSIDRQFLAALADVVFGNPFSAERAALIVRLAPGAKLGDLTQDPEALARLVAPRLAPWIGRNDLDAEDRRVLEPALLYVCYHRHVAQIDALIERQTQKAGPPLTVPFADEVIGDLVRSGFSEEASGRYLALFFQLRRAFYFIHPPLARR